MVLGQVIVLDLILTVNQSRWGGESSDLSADMYKYKVSEAWKSMSHLGGKNSVNPMSRLDAVHEPC